MNVLLISYIVYVLDASHLVIFSLVHITVCVHDGILGLVIIAISTVLAGYLSKPSSEVLNFKSRFEWFISTLPHVSFVM